MTVMQSVPAPVTLAPFPTTADRVAGVYNAKAKAWADGEAAMSAHMQTLASVTHNNATVATEQASGAATARSNAVAETTAIKSAAVSETTTIKDAAIAARDAARDAASASKTASQAAAAFKGSWAALSGALALPASCWHNNNFWVLLSSLPNVAAAQPGVSSAWAPVGAALRTLPYASRGDLRGAMLVGAECVLVDELGLFRFAQGATDPDDDESCFATAGGRWLLQAPHWDVIDAWMDGRWLLQAPHWDVIDARMDGRRLLQAPHWDVIDARMDGRRRAWRLAADCPFTSLAANTQALFTVAVPGALTTHSAVVSPPVALAPALACHARVTAANVVTVYVSNAGASTAAVVQADWRVTVF